MSMEEHPQELAENYYFVHDEFDVGSGIWTVRIGQNEAKPGYRSGPRSIGYYSLHFVRSGAVEVDNGRMKAVLGEGDLFCLFPQYACSYRMLDRHTPLRMIWIAFDGPQVPALLDMIPLQPDVPYARNKTTVDMQLTLQQLLQTGGQTDRYYKLKRCSLLYRLFSQLSEQNEEPATVGSGPEQWIPESLEYMKTHYGEPIGVNHVAEHVGIHRAYFSKLFTERIGMPPSDYLRKLRMNQAMALLRGTSRSILEIGLSLGYSDAASFTRAFGQYYGFSPKQARQTLGDDDGT